MTTKLRSPLVRETAHREPRTRRPLMVELGVGGLIVRLWAKGTRMQVRRPARGGLADRRRIAAEDLRRARLDARRPAVEAVADLAESIELLGDELDELRAHRWPRRVLARRLGQVREGLEALKDEWAAVDPGHAELIGPRLDGVSELVGEVLTGRGDRVELLRRLARIRGCLGELEGEAADLCFVEDSPSPPIPERNDPMSATKARANGKAAANGHTNGAPAFDETAFRLTPLGQILAAHCGARLPVAPLVDKLGGVDVRTVGDVMALGADRFRVLDALVDLGCDGREANATITAVEGYWAAKTPLERKPGGYTPAKAKAAAGKGART